MRYLVPLLLVLTLMMAACQPAPAAPGVAETPAAAEEEAAPEVEVEEEITPTEEIEVGEEMTPTEEIEVGEEMTPTEEIDIGEEITPTEEMTPTEGLEAGEEMTPTEEISPTEEMTPTEGMVGEDMATINLSEDDELGEYLTDAEGRTVYMFAQDEAGAGVSTCTDSCAENWPPVTVASADELTAGEGVDEGLLDTIERDDGTLQVTYNGWPLYLFANDQAAGDITGQGRGDNWYVLDAAGEPVGR